MGEETLYPLSGEAFAVTFDCKEMHVYLAHKKRFG